MKQPRKKIQETKEEYKKRIHRIKDYKDWGKYYKDWEKLRLKLKAGKPKIVKFYMK